jgi:hypothetical protein
MKKLIACAAYIIFLGLVLATAIYFTSGPAVRVMVIWPGVGVRWYAPGWWIPWTGAVLLLCVAVPAYVLGLKERK